MKKIASIYLFSLNLDDAPFILRLQDIFSCDLPVTDCTVSFITIEDDFIKRDESIILLESILSERNICPMDKNGGVEDTVLTNTVFLFDVVLSVRSIILNHKLSMK